MFHTRPLIGVPQAFGFGATPAPRAADVVAQTTAYCAAGVAARGSVRVTQRTQEAHRAALVEQADPWR